MITFHAASKFIVGHILAGAVVILGTLLVTFICCIAGLATARHGIDNPAAIIPEFLALMFTAGIFAVALSTGSFLISTLLVWIRSKRPFPVWLPPFVVALVTFLVALGARDMAFVSLATGIAFVYFAIYWTFLTSSAALLDFLRRQCSKSRTT